MNRNLFWGEPTGLNDGEYVWKPISRDAATGGIRVVRCIVSMAFGHHARIRELPFGKEEWARLSDLLVPPDDWRHCDYYREHEPEEEKADDEVEV